MSIWKNPINLEVLNSMSKDTILEQIGIEFTEFGDDYLVAKMPVDARTHQPFKLLHGGASGVLAESLGSSASVFCVDNPMENQTVGTELSCSHLRSARTGYVYGTCRPLKLGRTMHWWEIKITDEQDKLVCVSKLTVMVVNRSQKK